MEVLDSIPFTLDEEAVLRKLRPRRESEFRRIIGELVDRVRFAARPKAIYDISPVNSGHENGVYIAGTRFDGRILSTVLDRVETVFPYIATCGRELDQIEVPPSDLIRYYCLDVIKGIVLDSALSYLKNFLVRRHGLGKVAKIGPGFGDLPDFPIEQQKELFSILGNVEASIGVKLTDRFLMLPLKSESGIFFETEASFEDCGLCVRQACHFRTAPHNPSLLKGRPL